MTHNHAPFKKQYERMTPIEFLIIGQGISGSFLSWHLLKEGRSVLVIDNKTPTASSRVAAGVINPVTGRRIVPTWMIDEVLPFAAESYQAMGHQLGRNLITQQNIIDFFPSAQMMLSFQKRVHEVPHYLSLPKDPTAYQSLFRYDFGFGEISPGYTVNLSQLLASWRTALQDQGCLLEDEFREEYLDTGGGLLRYGDIVAEKIIFCDGVAGSRSRWFGKLPFALNKGEALLIKTDGIPPNRIYKKNISLVPMEDNIFWAGASYDWDFTDAEPSAAFRERALLTLRSWLKADFTVVDHLAAIRPATLERRPFVGMHPADERIGILNGMGTKGCSLAPFFSQQLTDHLLRNAPITPHAHVHRYAGILGG